MHASVAHCVEKDCDPAHGELVKDLRGKDTHSLSADYCRSLHEPPSRWLRDPSTQRWARADRRFGDHGAAVLSAVWIHAAKRSQRSADGERLHELRNRV